MINEVRVYGLNSLYHNYNDKACLDWLCYTDQNNQLLNVNLDTLSEGAMVSLITDKNKVPYSLDKVKQVNSSEKKRNKPKEIKYTIQKNTEVIEKGCDVTVSTGSDESRFIVTRITAKRILSPDVFKQFMTSYLGRLLIEQEILKKEESNFNALLGEGDVFTREQVLAYGLASRNFGIYSIKAKLSREYKMPCISDILRLPEIK